MSLSLMSSTTLRSLIAIQMVKRIFMLGLPGLHNLFSTRLRSISTGSNPTADSNGGKRRSKSVKKVPEFWSKNWRKKPTYRDASGTAWPASLETRWPLGRGSKISFSGTFRLDPFSGTFFLRKKWILLQLKVLTPISKWLKWGCSHNVELVELIKRRHDIKHNDT